MPRRCPVRCHRSAHCRFSDTIPVDTCVTSLTSSFLVHAFYYFRVLHLAHMKRLVSVEWITLELSKCRSISATSTQRHDKGSLICIIIHNYSFIAQDARTMQVRLFTTVHVRHNNLTLNSKDPFFGSREIGLQNIGSLVLYVYLSVSGRVNVVIAISNKHAFFV